jgi:hypothetical protein
MPYPSLGGAPVPGLCLFDLPLILEEPPEVELGYVIAGVRGAP